ncbi:uncharacterized protein TRIADDRAFT_58106 [Trichoplax adhaerens]|uniref:RGS domain-containing protein n=1 Tax=Trichoplax adhaerens TaxID=10228 RepID=B3S2Q1_TRIAD|nr:hypothetical protein TRIADDRAFT_58106 [Trichoplax adhaerens]EDV23133.1 hypothetical protein TRIADDRAFT_58106 [Trichoplax adhaerens]|eukprot:XP_002114043.1 hypothetical protein TRIADDRAFT_58106 [Trichoplax adhaerens]
MDVNEDNLETKLMYDQLLVEFLNEYLASPTFGERITYNYNTGNFESLRDELIDQKQFISSKRTIFIPPGSPDPNSCTSIHVYVKSIEKKIGLQWFKLHRLKSFLRSKSYCEYRLAIAIDQNWADHHSKKYSATKDSRFNVNNQKESLANSKTSQKNGTLSMAVSKKVMDEFKEFIQDSDGCKYFNFWVDIEYATLQNDLESDESYSNIIRLIRDKYVNNGSPNQFNKTFLDSTGLYRLSALSAKKLLHVQQKAFTELASYWYPRFMIWYQLQHKSLITDSSNSHRQITRSVAQSLSRPSSASNPSKAVSLCKVSFPSEPYFEELSIPKRRPQSAISARSRPSSARYKTKSLTQTPGLVDHYRQTLNQVDSDHESTKAWSQRNEITNCEGNGIKTIITNKGKMNEPKKQLIEYYDQEPLSYDNESLIQSLRIALENDSNCGNYFKNFLQQSGCDQSIKNCHQLWHDILEYIQFFHEGTFNEFKVGSFAKRIFSDYILPGSRFNIHCNEKLRKKVIKQLDPPYEDLFDNIEDFILRKLLPPWKNFLQFDKEELSKLPKMSILRYVETEEFIPILQRGIGVYSEDCDTESSLYMDSFESMLSQHRSAKKSDKDSVSFMAAALEALNGQHFVDGKGDTDSVDGSNSDSSFSDDDSDLKGPQTFQKTLSNRSELEFLRKFLEEKQSVNDLLCFLDIEEYRRVPHTDGATRNLLASQIKEKYLNRKYFFNANSPANKMVQKKIYTAMHSSNKLYPDCPSSSTLISVQKILRARLQKHWFPLFLQTEDFRRRRAQSMNAKLFNFNCSNSQQGSALKLLRSRWKSSSYDLIYLRKTLIDAEKSVNFQHFLVAKHNLLESNVLFWREVQKYKELCHSHAEITFRISKAKAIISRFIDSAVPPRIQISISVDIANRIVDQQRQAGPYIFREAQLTVFRGLFGYWGAYRALEATVTPDYFATAAEEAKKQRRERFTIYKKQIDEANKNNQMEDSSIGGDSIGVIEDSVEPEKLINDHHTSFRYSIYCKEGMATDNVDINATEINQKKNEDVIDIKSVNGEEKEEKLEKKQLPPRSKSARYRRKISDSLKEKEEQSNVIDRIGLELSTTKQLDKEDVSAKITVVKNKSRPSSASSASIMTQSPRYTTWKGNSSPNLSPKLSKQVHLSEKDVTKLKVRTQLRQRSHWQQIVNPSLPTCQEIILRRYANKFEVKSNHKKH